MVTGLRGYITRHNLAVHYLQAGRLEEAEAQWQQAVAEQPRYLPALRGLADVCLARGDKAAAERALRLALAIDANQPVCRRKLDELLRQRGQSA